MSGRFLMMLAALLVSLAVLVSVMMLSVRNMPEIAPPIGSARPANTLPDHGFLGIEMGTHGAPPEQVTKIVPGSGADRAGMLAGDLFQSADGKPVANIQDLRKITIDKQPGDTIHVAVKRDHQMVEIDIQLIDYVDLALLRDLALPEEREAARKRADKFLHELNTEEAAPSDGATPSDAVNPPPTTPTEPAP